MCGRYQFTESQNADLRRILQDVRRRCGDRAQDFRFGDVMPTAAAPVLLYLAGLYDNVDGANRFVILTTTPNASMHGIHDRMPLILRRDQIRPWLTDAESALHLLAAPPPLLERHSTDGQMSFGDLL